MPREAPPVQGVLFDYGDTLITVERPQAALETARARSAERLSQAHGLPRQEAALVLERVNQRLEALVGAHVLSGEVREIDLAAATDDAFTEAGLSLPPDELDHLSREEQEAWWSGVRVTPGATATLHELRRRGLRLGICSNAPYRAESLHAQLRHVGLAGELDSATFSAEVGWRKPSARLFEAALASLGTPPGSTVMVGDSAIADIDGARGVGMRVVRLRQHRDDAGAVADAVIDRIDELPSLLAGWTSY